MDKAQLEKFVKYLQKNGWSVFGPIFNVAKKEELSPFLAAHQPSPVKKTGEVLIDKIRQPADLDLNGPMPLYSFKRFFLPENELLFVYKKDKLTAQKNLAKTALVGMNILDLKAVNLYDQVFEKDPYYQARRRNTLIVGHSLTPQIQDPSTGSGQANLFEIKYEEDILEHLPFDIFLAANSKQLTVNSKTDYRIFTGSIKGQRVLEHFGYQDYEHIQFSGPVKEGLPDERMERLRDRLKNHHNSKIWEELGKICIECGKCTLACPTCFCFRIDDVPSLEEGSGQRTRCWDSCYFQEFSEVSGPDRPGQGKPKFLSTTAQRLHFWYYHKFARIPDEFNFMGCVGCRRCAAVCPVGIDIAEVLKKIETT